ncbi:MAG: S1C family serine protease [Catonella sp.]|uniref:S1C family serine protease n=1 Tax=Catonella sp. TaxID=2382125 RepID=UPI003FA0EB8B
MSDDKDYKFINEKIVPKKMHPVKKFLLGLIAVIVLGLVFGVVERVVFEVTGELLPHFQIFKKNNSIELGKKEEAATGAAISTKSAVEEKKEPEPATNKKQVKIIEKRISADLSDYRQVLNKFGELANKQNEAVVEVQSVVKGKDWFENPYDAVNRVAGYIIAVQNDVAYILTGYKGIKSADNIKVKFKQGFLTDATIKNYNAGLELALVMVNLKGIAGKDDIQPLKFDGINYKSIGEPVMAIGTPNGNLYSVLPGVITGTDILLRVDDYCLDTHFTDINISKNGDALFVDFDGNVIGIYFKGSSDATQIIGISKIMTFLEKMINDEPLPYIGIKTKAFEGAKDKTGISGGILIDSVTKGSPADDSGFKEGDIIYELDDVHLETMSDYENLLESKKPKDKIKVLIYRVTRNEGKKIELEVEIGDSRGIK